MLNKLPFKVKGANGQPVRGEIYKGERDDPPFLVIYCHGFKSFKDWGFHPYLCAAIAEEGFPVAAFNFSHNGVGEDPLEISDLDKFKRNTTKLEEQDLEAVIDAFLTRSAPFGSIDGTRNILLIGHSRASASIFPVAARRREVVGVASLAGISTAKRVTPEEEKEWRKAGETLVLNSRTGQQLPCGIEVLDDMIAGENKIEKAVKQLSDPFLVIHGSDDQSVAVKEGKRFVEWNTKECIYYEIESADHTFNCQHPFRRPAEAILEVKAVLLEYLSQTEDRIGGRNIGLEKDE